MATMTYLSSAAAYCGGGTSGDWFGRDRPEAEHYSVDMRSRVGVCAGGHAPDISTVHHGHGGRKQQAAKARVRSLFLSLLVSLSNDCFGFGAERWSGSDNDNGSTVAG